MATEDVGERPMERTIAHIDMDAFYASVEQRDNPALRGKPLIVGGRPGGRGVVSAASYEARAFGVRSAMPSSQAQRLCPQAIFIQPNIGRYAEVSSRIMEIMGRYTPLVEPVSIDEAYLDLTGTERLHGDTVDTARRIKTEIQQRERLTASVGVGPSKLVAKLASDYDKPDGFVVVRAAEVRAFLDPMPVGRLFGVGQRTRERLERLGLSSVGSLARCPEEVLIAHFGPHAGDLAKLARGEDHRLVTPEHDPKSLSAERTFETDVEDVAELEKCLLALSDTVARRLRKAGLRAGTVEMKLRYDDFHTVTRARKQHESVDSGAALYRVAIGMLHELQLEGRKIRLVGVGGSDLVRGEDEVQLSLFHDDSVERGRRIDKALDLIRDRFGRDKATRASLMDTED
jgi:DNA polymerase-4